MLLPDERISTARQPGPGLSRVRRAALRLALAATVAAGLAACAAPGGTRGASSPAAAAGTIAAEPAAVALPSWRDGPARQRIEAFVQAVATPGSADFVPPRERIAVFDNDGTLWAERPFWFSVQFYLDRVRELAPDHPEWRQDALLGPIIAQPGEQPQLKTADVIRLAQIAETGISQEAFRAAVQAWFATARHPGTGRLYRDMVYQPMLELLDYLRAHGFKTYISTGGFDEFTRALAPVYGLGPEQVIATRWKMKYEETPAGSRVLRLPELDFYNYNDDKAVAIEHVLGQRPLLAVGNSDGDLAMLTYAADRAGPSLAILLDHDDDAREYAYRRGADKSLQRAAQRHWLVLSMRADWAAVYPAASGK